MIRNIDEYKDIINMPHHVSKKHPPMSMEARAAQFAPFAALTGYGDSVKETARLTVKKREINEELKEELDVKLQNIKNNIQDKPKIQITYFKKDTRKEGGEYISAVGTINKINEYENKIIFENNIGEYLEIKIEEIIDINDSIF